MGCCFQLLENHIKSEVIDNTQLVHALSTYEENKPPFSEPRRSVSVACGARVFEICMKVPTWASQVLSLPILKQKWGIGLAHRYGACTFDLVDNSYLFECIYF